MSETTYPVLEHQLLDLQLVQFDVGDEGGGTDLADLQEGRDATERKLWLGQSWKAGSSQDREEVEPRRERRRDEDCAQPDQELLHVLHSVVDAGQRL